MPTNHWRRIRDFMQTVGQDTPSDVTVPAEAVRLLRAKLILEEALETTAALGVAVTLKDTSRVKFDDLTFSPDGEVDLECVVDGCADISVVTIGTLISFGVDDEPVLEEVDRANLRKFGPGSYMRADGKWIKPPGWTPPDIAGVLARQSA